MDNPFEIVKSALRIEEVIGEYISLRRSGRNMVGMCPFHSDRSPSLTVSSSKQIYKCFACGAGGDVIQFVSEYESVTLGEALELLAGKAGIKIDRREDTEHSDSQRRFHDAMRFSLEQATLLYERDRPLAEEFLSKRGFSIDHETVKSFRMGYASGIVKSELTSVFPLDVLIHADLIKSGERGIYDTFRERIMFPFVNVSGKVIGFTGRYIGEGTYPKYLNTGDTHFFNKGKVLFGIYQSKRSIAEENLCYIVEGQFDVVSLHSVGVCNVVAGSGTSFSSEQINLIERFTKNVVLAYDSDPAGIKAATGNIRLFLERGFTVRCILLDQGEDPDNIAQRLGVETKSYLEHRTVSYVSFLCRTKIVEGLSPEELEQAVQEITDLISVNPAKNVRKHYCGELSELTGYDLETVVGMVKGKLRRGKELVLSGAPIYGMEELSESELNYCTVTGEMDIFLELYGDEPVIMVNVHLDKTLIQSLRKTIRTCFVTESELSLSDKGEENHLLRTLVDLFKSGIRDITVFGEGGKEEKFLNFYINAYETFFAVSDLSDYTELKTRCCEVISYADDSYLIFNLPKYQKQLGISSLKQMKDMINPLKEKIKSKNVYSIQRNDDEEEDFDTYAIPDYVEENEVYRSMYSQYGFYPKLNREGEPIAYVFRNDTGGHFVVGDFYMQPQLHIMSDNDEMNKRVVKIYRRYYKQPIYTEFNSKALLKRTSIEERLIMLEAVNFSNGSDKHWTKIREWMSRNFVACTEIVTYGNQQEHGFSRREEDNFFAFSNGIYHQDQGAWQFTESNEIGIVSHSGKNYYLPAYSAIYAGSRVSDKYETISQLVFKNQPLERRVSFERWAYLMDQVYKINDNGKWALIYAFMCAFRSNIHAIDRLFTAPFFMGPMSGGKTQIAISIRSLFIDKSYPIFNLNIGTDAAMSTLMSTFKDVPVVLDEYNNKDISDVKFQALKGVVYDGDGKQKRRAAGSKEIENDKVYAPVIICGQETPQRDDNALMSRVIVCEVAKQAEQRTQESVDLFDELKKYESYDRYGLSHILEEILKIRPIVQADFARHKTECYRELKQAISSTGEIDRMMKTVSLFLSMVKIIESLPLFTLPFTYEEFKLIAIEKVKAQMGTIRQSDKLANFFNVLDKLIDSGKVVYGWELEVDHPSTLTLINETGSMVRACNGEEILYLRVSDLHILYTQSLLSEDLSLTTLKQNLRSSPAYIGVIKSKRFTKKITVEKEYGAHMKELDQNYNKENNQVVRVIETITKNTSCVCFNYDKFQEIYGIDFRRTTT